MELKQIEISKIKPNPFQPRMEFDKEALQEMADNISKHGMIEPIVVTPKGDNYVIVAGERRWRANKLAKKDKMYAIIKEYKTDADIKRDSLIENEMRENLNNEEFKSFVFSLAKSLGEPYYNKGYIDANALSTYIVGNIHCAMADKIRDFFRIEKQASLKVKKLLKEDKIDRRTATTIASIPDKEIQNKLADMAKHKTTTEVRQEVARHNFEQKAKELKSLGESNERKQFSEDRIVTKLLNKSYDSKDRIKFIAGTLQVINNKAFVNKLSSDSKLQIMDCLKPLNKEIDRLSHIVKKIMEMMSE